jgi:FMN phosphatase YigB (HAD superfamily)
VISTVVFDVGETLVDETDLTPTIKPRDLYPDAVPALGALSDEGYTLGLAGNQPAR